MPGTFAVAFNSVESSGVPAWTAAGCGQVITGAEGVMATDADAVPMLLFDAEEFSLPVTVIMPTDLLRRILPATSATEVSDTVQVVWLVTFCGDPLLMRVACRATVPPTATLEAAA